MQNKILGEVSFAAQYAKPIEGGRESWIVAVNRVESMHQKKFKDLNLETEIQKAFDFVREKRVFASQRSTQFGGAAIERNNMRMFNCTFSSCDRVRFFAECFWLLLSFCFCFRLAYNSLAAYLGFFTACPVFLIACLLFSQCVAGSLRSQVRLRRGATGAAQRAWRFSRKGSKQPSRTTGTLREHQI